MSEKRKSKTLKKRNPKAIEVSSKNPKDPLENEKAVAQAYLRPTVMAASTIKGRYTDNDDVNINALINELGSQVSKVKEGDMGRAEGMLIAQAHTLDALFAELVSRSRSNMGQYLPAACKFMALAFKAQSQCRCTLEALAEIKNPRPYIQNNKGQYVQVNNGELQHTKPLAHGKEKPESTNKLLEDKRHEQEWLDTGTPEAAGGNDKELEAVGAQHRAEDRGG